MRLRKDEDALGRQRRAIAITAEAHVAAMRAAKGGMYEYEIEALVDYTFRRRGCSGPGYGTIVGGGDNATILHYVDNKDPLVDGQLLLIDAGGEYQGYTADVTRTFPINARFNPAQRRLYELVLSVEKSCIARARPGATVDGIHEHAVERLTAGMVELGLLVGEVPKLIESNAYRRFYMHRTSHWLGLDVHDVGSYGQRAPDGTIAPRPLVPGMVLTVEPGIYVAADAHDVAAEYRGIGIRIEDDVLVTDGEPEVLTAAVPKEVAEIEALTTAPRLAL
jgi:Xaa-Pro aminopeptidase